MHNIASKYRRNQARPFAFALGRHGTSIPLLSPFKPRVVRVAGLLLWNRIENTALLPLNGDTPKAPQPLSRRSKPLCETTRGLFISVARLSVRKYGVSK